MVYLFESLEILHCEIIKLNKIKYVKPERHDDQIKDLNETVKTNQKLNNLKYFCGIW